MKTKQSLIGRRFGKLTVIASAEARGYNKRWLCKCDCGTEKVVYQNALCRGMTRSCGCYSAEASRKRMSAGWDKVFTKEFLQKEHIESKRSLREIAKEKGCTLGCIVRYMKKHGLQANDPFHDLTGKKFEMLTAISFAYTKGGTSYWNVQCECGKTKTVQAMSLVRHKIVSCGCWNRKKNWQGCGGLSKTYWSRLVGHAVHRGISFNITIDYAWKLFQEQNGKCALSGEEIILDPQYSEHCTRGKNKQTASLDRIDSKRGYCEDNVQWVHLILNRMKSDLEQSDFIRWCKNVTEHNLT